MPEVTRLFRYPIKGGRRIELSEVDVDEVGFPADRRFIVVDADGEQVTQREVPALALVDPLSIDVVTQPVDGPLVPVTVFDWSGFGIDQGDPVAEQLSDQLGQRVRLLRFPDDQQRHADIGNGLTRYTDGQTLLVVSMTSLEGLNDRLDDPVPIERFRPNIVLSGIEDAWAEDDFTAARIGAVDVDFVEWCGRCIVTTVDQDTGVKGNEPLKTLGSFRQKRKPNGSNAIVFGHYAIPRSLGRISVGDEFALTGTDG